MGCCPPPFPLRTVLPNLQGFRIYADIIKKIPENFEAWTHQIEPNTMLQVIIIMLKCRSGIVRRIYKNAVFDTNRKKLLRHISAEKGLK